MDQSLLNFAKIVAKNAAQELMRHYRTEQTTSRATPKEIKTTFDLIADKVIKEQIAKTYPDHSILTEETGLIEKKSDYLWIIDPLDGTGNFVNSNPFFAVSIAIWFKGKPFLGVIEAPALGERFFAITGGGAFHEKYISINAEEAPTKASARVSQVSELKNSYLVFCHGGSKNRQQVLQGISKIYPQVKDMRILGSAALELAWVGAGRAEAYLTPEISSWDIAAGLIFVAEAGGQVRDFEGNPIIFESNESMDKNGYNLVASNGLVPLDGINL